MTEFQTYLNLLLRYYGTVRDNKVREEFAPSMLESCKYLLEKTRGSLQAYTDATGRTELQDRFAAYETTNLSLLRDVALIPMASVAYAHQVNYRYRNVEPDQQANNYSANAKRVESIVVAREMEDNRLLGNAAGVSTLGLVGLLAGYIAGVPVDQLLPLAAPMGLGLTAVGAGYGLKRLMRRL